MNSKKIIIFVSIAVIAIVGSIWFFKTRHSSLPKYIPKTAYGVMKLNPLSIGGKIDFDAIKKMRSYQPIFKDFVKSFETSDKKLSQFIENPSNIGMSFTDNIYIFGSNLTENNQKAVGVVFAVSDAELLKKFIESFAKDANLVFEKSGNLNIYKTENPIISSDTLYDSSMEYENEEEEISIVWNDEACLIYYAGKNSLATAKKIMTQPEKEAIYSEESFKNTENEGGDMSVYMNYSKGFNSLLRYVTVPQKLKKQIENLEAVSLVVNFNDQDITTNYFQYYKDQSLAKEFQMLKNEGLSEESLGLISPNGKILLGMTSMLDIPSLIQLLKSFPEAKSTMKELASNIGITDAELESLLDGSLSFALTKLSTKEIEETVYDFENMNPETGEFEQKKVMNSRVVPILTAQLGFQNEKTLTKLLKFLQSKSMGMVQYNNNIMTTSIGFLGTLNCVQIGNKLVFTNDDENAKILAKNKTWNNQLDKDISTLFSEYPTAFYLDLNLKNYGINKICKGLHIPEESDEMKLVIEVMENFKNFQIQGDNKFAKSSLTFNNGTDNSLMSIMKMADKIATTMRKKRVEREAAQRQMEMDMEQEAIRTESSLQEEMQ